MDSKHPPQPSDKFLKSFEFAAELAEKEEEFTEEIINILLRFVEIKDSLENILEEISKSTSISGKVKTNIMKRLGLLNRQLQLAFERSEVRAIMSLGEEPNPEIHEVVEVEERSDVEPDIIILEKVRGYFYREHLLRRPQVVVSKSQKN